MIVYRGTCLKIIKTQIICIFIDGFNLNIHVIVKFC